jgi:hypothetical protein
MATTVLLESFDSISEWAVVNPAFTTVTGRTGIGVQMSTNGKLIYTIPPLDESDTLTLGFALTCNSLASNRPIMQLSSDSGGTTHLSIAATTTGAIEIRRGTPSGTVIFTTATGLIVAGVSAYVEIQVKLHDTAGVVTVRVDGTQTGPTTGLDTKNVGTKTTFDTVVLTTTSVQVRLDDLYIITGSDGVFLGEQRIDGFNYNVLHESFNDLNNWTTISGSPIIVPGRTGSAVSLGGSGDVISYSIPSPQRSYQIVIGFALYVEILPIAAVSFVAMRGGGNNKSVLTLTNSGAMTVSTSFAGTPVGTITAGVWNYVEAYILHGGSSGGAATIRKNDVVVGGPDIDRILPSSGAFNPQIIDEIRINGVHATGEILVDDLYIHTGTLSNFEGDQTVFQEQAAWIWTGTAWENKPMMIWNGSAWVSSINEKIWDGTQWVMHD